MYHIILAFLSSLTLSFLAMPVIIRIARKRHLYSEPGERRSHQIKTPLLGGIGIFLSSLLSILIWTPQLYFSDMQYILGALLLMFFIGARDDFEPASPYYKFIFQLIAACILVFAADVRLTSLYGIFAIHAIPDIASYLLSIIVIATIINAFNLIDGIDGLSGSIGVLMSISFGIWFYLVDQTGMVVIAMSLAGSLLAFLYYNITPAKVFMGDTGSLFLGTVASILAIQFIEMHQVLDSSPYAFESCPAIAIGILAIPLFDTVRLFVTRISKGKSPFKADRNHIHHLLLDIGLNHMQGTAVLIAVNLMFIVLVYQLQEIGTLRLILLLLFVFSILTAFIYYLRSQSKSSSKSSRVQNSY